MIRLSTVLTDLSRYYKGYIFINRKSINKIILSFFEIKFNLFLKEQENEIDLLKRYNNIIGYINYNTISPKKNQISTIKDIVAFKYKFMEDFKDELFDAIPNSLKKKEIKKDLSKYTDENIELKNSFLFSKYMLNIEEYNELNFNFLLNAFSLRKENIPARLLYIFDLNCSKEELGNFPYELKTLPKGFIYKRNYYFNNLFLSYMFSYYIILYVLCFESVSKYFLFNDDFAFPQIERDTKEIKNIYKMKNELKTEIINRNMEVNFIYNDNMKKYCKEVIKDDKIFNDMLELLLYLKSTLIHID